MLALTIPLGTKYTRMCTVCTVVYGQTKYARLVGYAHGYCKCVGTACATNIKKKNMASLKELCKNVPLKLLHAQANYNVVVRTQTSYNKRMNSLDVEQAVFEQCKRQRSTKRVRNSFSREEAGTCGMNTRTVRAGKYTTIVCKSRKMY